MTSTASTSLLFQPLRVGAWALPHRVVMAPLTRNRAPGQLPNALMATYYAQRADPRDGAALIISEATPVCPEGHGYADTPGLHSPEQVQAWRAVTDAVHAAGGLIVAQLWHVGRISHTALQPGGQAPVAPSAVRAQAKTYLIETVDGQRVGRFVEVSQPRALRLDELPGIVQAYAQAARNALDAGFDGVEVHAANGYLLDQFLRRGSNLRTDAYGGPIEHRARLLLEVMQAVTEAIGPDRVGLRLSPVTPANDAWDDEPQPLFEYVVRQLAPMGLAYLHIIEGQTGGARDFQQGAQPFDYAALRRAYRDAGGRGAWMVNNGYDRALAEQALAQGADLVAFGRPFISNPDLTRRLREGLPLTEPDRRTFYGGGPTGYTDYPRAP
ncbi:alkene reductase [Tepidimonas aquatica]|uniref:N-ethylmaleimide reductase n=1 Tax=Tepidimonas aquatica TaxID=247482 RepID=A0A554WE64_9BURK|nr:alkene reductase [Tepidimonas aquatica]TSE21865.1 N-ethylmaleimide reductase [Tepidimonas aquatica]